MHDAFNAALQRWPVEGVPAIPRAWLISTARFKAIDAIRRRARFDASQDHIADALYGDEAPPGPTTSRPTTGSSSSSPAATPRLRPTPARRSRCARCAG
jgi:DNA-directed RNA polymerase specialized sigma24 family protein